MEPITLQAVAGATRADITPLPTRGDGIPADITRAQIAAVCTDSRTIPLGCVFVALKGPAFDGHRFVCDALRQGAAAAIVERAQVEDVRAAAHAAGVSGFLLAVDDTLLALGDVARWYRARFSLPVVGITGSVGKTSTKEMAAAILAQRGPMVCTQANFNNEIGLPLTLFRLGNQHTSAVVEMAMRGVGQIRYLAEIARPRIGVITNIGTSHLELLGSREAIARAKGELLETLPTDGAAVLPAADPFLPLLRSLSRAPVITFGFAGPERPDVAVTALAVKPTESHFVIEGLGARIPVRLPLPGRHNALNAVAAAATALHAGARPEQIAAGLGSCRLPGMRMQVTQTAAGVTVLDDTYNASPASMKAALDHLRQLPGQRRAAVLGDMLELGAESGAGHREVGAAAAFADLLLAVGERARDIAAGARAAGLPAERVQLCADADAALALLRDWVRPGDALLVKASRGMHLETIAQGLQDA